VDVELKKCPNCGGRISITAESDKSVLVACIGMAGDDESCGWTDEVKVEPDSKLKRSA